MRLCVIGSSHIAALKLAWDAGQPLLGLAPSFYPVRMGRGESVRVEGDCLKPMTERCAARLFKTTGRNEISLAGADAVCICALGVGADTALAVYTRHRPWPWNDGAAPISDAVVAAAMEGSIRMRPLVGVVSAVRQITDVPIVLVPVGAPTRAVVEQRPFSWLAKRPGLLADCLGRFQLALEAYCDAQRIGLLPQPPNTLREDGYTADEYMLYPHGIPGGPAVADPYHMNAAYGALVWEQLQRRLLPA